MRRILSTAAALLLLLTPVSGCRSGAPEATSAHGPRRVVLVSYDGAGADLVWRWLEEGVLTAPGGVGEMVAAGTSARRVRMVNPTLTSVNHISLATGAEPGSTGIVSNFFHRPGQKITNGVSGFSASIGVETLWEAARRQGKRVGVLTWPGADGTSDRRRGDFGLVWPGRPLARSAVLELDPARAGHGAVLPSHDGLPPLVWTVTLELRDAEPPGAAFTVTVVDGNPDGVAAYDTVAVTPPGEESPEILDRRGWFPVSVTARGPGDERPHPWGAWCKVLHLDTHSGNLRLYRGEVHRVRGYPEDFERRIEEAVGFWPGPPDGRGLGRWWLDVSTGVDLDTFLEQLERLDRYLDRVAAFAAANEDFDLLMAYHPTPDEYQHAGLIVERRQWAWSPGTALAAAEGLRRVGRSFDRSVASWWEVLDPTRDALVVVSDHGLLPLHDVVNVNRVLADAGLVKVDASGDRPRAAADTPMLAFASGGSAHLYLNLEGREPGGVVRQEEVPELLRRAARALADVVVDGEPAVERIFTREEAAAIGLGNPNTGDLVVFARPGFAFSGRLEGKAVEPSRYYGQHGYLNTHPGLSGIFFARGAGVARQRLDEIPATSIARRVSAWLGMVPPGR